MSGGNAHNLQYSHITERIAMIYREFISFKLADE